MRLGVQEVFGVRVVTPLLARLLDTHPDLSIDLLALPRFANLANREADLGVMGGPGVTKCLDIIRNELDLTMAFCGLRDLRDVDRNILLPGTF